MAKWAGSSALLFWALLWSSPHVEAQAARPLPPHVRLALSFRDYRETGRNRGFWVDEWNRSVGNPLGSPYCSAFGYWCAATAGAKNPVRTGWARGWIRPDSPTANDALVGRFKSQPGDAVIWRRDLRNGRIAGHVGFLIEPLQSARLRTIEANTSSGMAGSQADGGGVYIRVRRIEPFNKFRITNFARIRF